MDVNALTGGTCSSIMIGPLLASCNLWPKCDGGAPCQDVTINTARSPYLLGASPCMSSSSSRRIRIPPLLLCLAGLLATTGAFLAGAAPSLALDTPNTSPKPSSKPQPTQQKDEKLD